MINICCEEFEKLDMTVNAKKSHLVRIGRSHNKVVHGVVLHGELIECVDELKYLGWYILSAKSFKVSLNYMRVRFFSFNSLYAKSYCFSEPVMQHLVNVYCKPYLLYGADVINWTQSELASIKWTFNSAVCKIYKVKFQQLDDIYKYTCQLDIADVIMRRHRNFLCNLWHSPNVIIRHLASVEL